MFPNPSLQNSDSVFAGIDLHRDYAFITMMNKMGTVTHQGRYNNSEDTLVPALLQIQNRFPLEAVLESTYGWYWLADKLESARIPFKLAHPKKVKDIVGNKKTDKCDSFELANLLRTNYLSTAYVPTKQERSLRELLRYRLSLVHYRSGLKRRLRDILAKQNMTCDYKDIAGKKARMWLKELNCPYPYQDEINGILTVIDGLNQPITTFTKKVKTHGQELPTVKLLKTIPGIGYTLGLTLAVEIGDINRFANERALSAYAGLVPSVYSSGDKTHYGRCTKHGNKYLRWTLAESLKHVLKKDPRISDFYERIEKRKGKSKARVAVMNKVMRSIYFMLTRGQQYKIGTSTLVQRGQQNPKVDKTTDRRQVIQQRQTTMTSHYSTGTRQ